MKAAASRWRSRSRALSAPTPGAGRQPLAAYGDPVLSGYEAPGASRGAFRGKQITLEVGGAAFKPVFSTATG